MRVDESNTPPVLADLTALELAIVDAARRGVLVEPEIAIDTEGPAITEDSCAQVRAELIRELLMGRRGELDPRGVRIRAVRLVGRLDLNHVTAVTGLRLFDCVLPDGVFCRYARLREMNLRGSALPFLFADGLQAESDLVLRDVTVHGSREEGTVQLRSAHIGGELDLEASDIANDTGPALVADSLHAEGRVSLHGATMRGTGEKGTIRLVGASLSGQLSFGGSEITNDTGPAIRADSLRTSGRTSLQKATLRGVSEDGTVRLVSATFGGQLSFEASEITNGAGPALYADRVRTGSRLSLRNATMRGTRDGGTVRLLGAHIGGQLDLEHSEITNDTDSALTADALHIDSDAFLGNAIVRGAGKDETIRLVGANIGGYADLTVKELSHDAGRLLDLTLTRVEEVLVLPARVVCPSGDTQAARPVCPSHGRQMNARGLRFASLESVSWRQWLHLLVHHTPTYSPQPYQQLAAVERAAGHDNNARHILITQQEDLRHRAPEALGGRIGQWRHWLWGSLGRYGYRAHRLVTALALTLALAGGLGYLAGHLTTRPGHHAAERVPPPGAASSSPGKPCSTAELIGVGIDRGLPIGATGLRARCELDTGTRWGQAFTYALWVLQALVWALATLAIAAYTGLVRKPT